MMKRKNWVRKQSSQGITFKQTERFYIFERPKAAYARLLIAIYDL